MHRTCNSSNLILTQCCLKLTLDLIQANYSRHSVINRTKMFSRDFNVYAVPTAERMLTAALDLHWLRQWSSRRFVALATSPRLI